MSQQEVRVYSDRYELKRHVARGGMAEVYLAHDRWLDRPVALKVLFPELSTDRAFVERFRREAQAAANLTHPNIVSVYDWGEEENTYFIVMEYIDGRPLSSLLRSEGSLLPDRAAGICADVAAALAFAHRNGVIHRDVKPGNVLLTNDGTVKVADFGIARAANADENLTQTGAVMGTATYFSPEQAQGTSVDARSDVYSLGVVLYELVTGKPPFSGDNPVSIAYKHVQEDPVAPRKRNPAVPAAFEAIILQAMSKDPAQRYQSAEEMRADLLRYQQGRQVMAVPPVAAAAAAATQAVPVTTVQDRYVADGGGTTVIPVTAAGPPPSRGIGKWLVLLLVLLALLGVALFFLGREAGLFGEEDTGALNVPNVVGLEVNAAEQQLRNAGLIPTRKLEPSDAQPENNVFDQDPKAGTGVAAGANVTILVSSGQASVRVPSVVGRNVDDATSTLQEAGFNVEQKLQTDDRRESGIVISQNPVGGNTKTQGETVTITVSTGKARVTVPDVTGQSSADAAAAIRNAGLAVAQTNAPDNADADTVISTDPAAGQEVDKGSRVNMVVSTGPTTTTTTTPPTTSTTVGTTTTTVAQATVPDTIGKTEAVARSELTAAGFRVQSAQQSVTDPEDVGKVMAQSPGGGAVRPKGSNVTIIIGATA